MRPRMGSEGDGADGHHAESKKQGRRSVKGIDVPVLTKILGVPERLQYGSGGGRTTGKCDKSDNAAGIASRMGTSDAEPGQPTERGRSGECYTMDGRTRGKARIPHAEHERKEQSHGDERLPDGTGADGTGTV